MHKPDAILSEQKQALYTEISAELSEFGTKSTRELVFDVCDAFLRRGIMPPQWPDIRTIIGGGSGNTINSAKKEWSETALKGFIPAEVSGLPPDPQIQHSFHSFITLLSSHVRSQQEAAWQEEKTQILASVSTMREVYCDLEKKYADSVANGIDQASTISDLQGRLKLAEDAHTDATNKVDELKRKLESLQSHLSEVVLQQERDAHAQTVLLLAERTRADQFQSELQSAKQQFAVEMLDAKDRYTTAIGMLNIKDEAALKQSSELAAMAAKLTEISVEKEALAVSHARLQEQSKTLTRENSSQKKLIRLLKTELSNAQRERAKYAAVARGK